MWASKQDGSPLLGFRELGVQGRAEVTPGSPWTCELGQVVKGGQSGRWRRERLIVLDQLLCLLPQPGRFHLGLFQKFPWKERGEGEREELLSSVRWFPPPHAAEPALAWLLTLWALDLTPTIVSWVSWDTRHSSPQPETGREGSRPCSQGRRSGGGPRTNSWPRAPSCRLAPTTAGQGSLKPTIGAQGPPTACTHSQGPSEGTRPSLTPSPPGLSFPPPTSREGAVPLLVPQSAIPSSSLRCKKKAFGKLEN